jgi:drug/metabolite transporter (DMT)-like permease
MSDRTVIAVAIAAVLMGGANVVAVRYSNEGLAPFWGAALRFILASALFFAIVLVRRTPLPRGAALGGVLGYGILGFGASYAFVYWGLLEAPAGLAAVVVATVPLLTVFAAALHGLERLRWRSIAGAGIALGGVVLIVADQLAAAVPLPSLLALLAGAVCIAESMVLAKMTARAEPAATNAVGMATGAVTLVVLALLAREPIGLPATPAATAALAYLVVLGSVGLFAAFLYVVRRWTASASAYLLVFMPLVATPLAAATRGESVGAVFTVGMALVLAGVYLGALARRTPAAVPCSPPECSAAVVHAPAGAIAAPAPGR